MTYIDGVGWKHPYKPKLNKIAAAVKQALDIGTVNSYVIYLPAGPVLLEDKEVTLDKYRKALARMENC